MPLMRLYIVSHVDGHKTKRISNIVGSYTIFSPKDLVTLTKLFNKTLSSSIMDFTVFCKLFHYI